MATKEAATMTEAAKPEAKQLTIRIPAELHTRMQIYKAREGTKLQDLVIEGVQRLLEEKGY